MVFNATLVKNKTRIGNEIRLLVTTCNRVRCDRQSDVHRLMKLMDKLTAVRRVTYAGDQTDSTVQYLGVRA